MILYDLLNSSGVQKILGLINDIIGIIRIIVPIGLIVMTSLDIAKKVINPDDKDGQKKIMHRLLAALIVFLLPVFISIIMKIINIGLGDSQNNLGGTDSNNVSVPQNNNNETMQGTGGGNDGNIDSKIDIKMNCPNDKYIYEVGDKFIINLKVPSNYNGKIDWQMFTENDVVKIIPSQDTLSATVEVLKNSGFGKINISVIDSQGRGSNNCSVNIWTQNHVTGDILINNCPKNKVKVGESFVVSTNESNVKWSNFDEHYDLVDNHNGTATVKVVKSPQFKNSSLSIQASNSNGKYGYCYFYINND